MNRERWFLRAGLAVASTALVLGACSTQPEKQAPPPPPPVQVEPLQRPVSPEAVKPGGQLQEQQQQQQQQEGADENAGAQPGTGRDTGNQQPGQQSEQQDRTGTGSQDSETAAGDSMPSAGGLGETDRERVQSLDRSLDNQLGEFDEMLRQDSANLATARQQAHVSGLPPDGNTGGAAGDTQLEGGGGRDADMAGNADAATRGEGEGRRDAGLSRSADASAGTARGIPDGRDDDIVARQLREAAERESDPQLKEKLWQEYRDYKRGSSGS